MLNRLRVPEAALLVAGLAGLLAAPAAAKDEKPAPTMVHVGVKGLDKDTGKAIEKALKALESVTDAKANDKMVMAQVKPEKTLKLSEVLAAIAAQSTDERKLEADRDGVALAGTVKVTTAGTGEAKDDDVIAALKSVPNVDKVEGKGTAYTVTFKSAKGATVGDVVKALQAKLGAAEGKEPPSVGDVAWTAPKGGGGKEHGGG